MKTRNENRPIAELNNQELHFEKVKNRKVILDVLTSKEIHETDYPAIEFLVDGLIPARGLTLLCGASKTGKSWMVLQLLHVLCSGGIFLGQEVANPCSCLYLALEDSPSRLKGRERKMGVAPADNLFMTTACPSNGEGIKAIRDTLEALPEVKVAAIDTYGRFASGRSESTFQNDYDWMGRLKTLADECNIALILVHHTRKMRDELDAYNEILGTTANMAVADSILLLIKNRFSNDGELSCTSRDYESKTLPVRFDTASCTWKLRDASTFRASSPERQRLLDILKEHGEMSPAELATHINSTPKNISNILAAMSKEGIVIHGSKRGYWKVILESPPEAM
ncbi:AAA family ATPase [Breznakiella homolactica]|uniref:AAA family ATPase n=1 Tax=Breznakiella homolactica TaxID=2798577 RepID=A0A7T7XLX7_9SPIR|nr:AAA family ATPase [Breznakiella homolactica]QQO08653.1 AAA family ATPase [Breznakiella homolactica]